MQGNVLPLRHQVSYQDGQENGNVAGDVERHIDAEVLNRPQYQSREGDGGGGYLRLWAPGRGIFRGRGYP